MPADSADVCNSGKIRNERRTAKSTRLTLLRHQRPPKIFLLSSRDVFRVSRLGRYNCRILIVGVGKQRREFSPDRPAVNSAGWNHSALTADTSLRLICAK